MLPPETATDAVAVPSDEPRQVAHPTRARQASTGTGDGAETAVEYNPRPRALPTNALERLLDKQLELMASQLELLRDSGAASSLADDSTPLQAEEALPSPAAGAAHAPANGTVSHRVWALPTDRPGASGGLTPRQQQHLDDLIARYTRRTAESKRLTEAHRPHLADPRSVSGFRTAWKEMVYPIVVARSSGSRLWDVDGNEYVDLVNGFGMNLFGHSPEFVTAALRTQLRLGMEIGPQSPLAGTVAELVCEMTGMERVAFCNTGSEAMMAALRVAGR